MRDRFRSWLSVAACVLCLAKAGACSAADLSVERHDLSGLLVTLVVTLDGEIRVGDDLALTQILNSPPITNRIAVYLRSDGGDVATAVKIGRLLRSRDAWTTAVRCLSACVLVFAGGVHRFVYSIPTERMGLGIHRFYFDQAPRATTRADIANHYREMKNLVATYLADMNISPALLSVMEGVPPERMRFLTEQEVQTYGLEGKDPVWDEQQTAKWAVMHGISSGEYRRREARAEATCGRDPGKFFECRAAILYGLPVHEYKRRLEIAGRVCEKYASETSFAACARAVMVEGKTSY